MIHFQKIKDLKNLADNINGSKYVSVSGAHYVHLNDPMDITISILDNGSCGSMENLQSETIKSGSICEFSTANEVKNVFIESCDYMIEFFQICNDAISDFSKGDPGFSYEEFNKNKSMIEYYEELKKVQNKI